LTARERRLRALGRDRSWRRGGGRPRRRRSRRRGRCTGRVDGGQQQKDREPASAPTAGPDRCIVHTAIIREAAA